ncbi:MAG: hypothetical protein ABSH32_04700 [Bryobacteraceae bacterium]
MIEPEVVPARLKGVKSEDRGLAMTQKEQRACVVCECAADDPAMQLE